MAVISPDFPAFSRIAVIGLGLIGSSFARAVKQHHPGTPLAGCDSDTAHRDAAHAYCDTVTGDAAQAVSGADLVVIAARQGAFESIARAIGPALAAGTIVTDTGSVKQAAIDAIVPHLPAHAMFIPGHPIAGGEKSGPHHGSADLFAERLTLLTPQEPEMTAALARVKHLWTQIGAQVELMPPGLHDRIYACVSHLPHLLAFGAAHALAAQNLPPLPLPDSCRRFLRIGGADGPLWSDICLANREEMLRTLEDYLPLIAQIHGELREGAMRETLPPASPEMQYHAATLWFPRIAASALITATTRAERASGIGFARFGGRGFQDFIFPILNEVEGDLEAISQHPAAVVAVLEPFLNWLHQTRRWITQADAPRLSAMLCAAQSAQRQVTSNLSA